MQDYAHLYRSESRISYKQQVNIIRDILEAGKSPLVTVLSIMVFLSGVKR
mgnify:CR=1 FL=1